MILNDQQITDLYNSTNFINPFFNTQIRETAYNQKIISYGLSSFGYDIRLSEDELKIRDCDGIRIIDPTDNENTPTYTPYIQEYNNREYVKLPPQTVLYGLSVERFNLPDNIVGLAVGKSTYARAGVNVLVTPLEPSWKGRLVIEIANLNRVAVKIYVNEGITQILWLQGEKPNVTYADRAGKYQNQEHTDLGKL